MNVNIVRRRTTEPVIPDFVEPTPPASDILIKLELFRLSTMFQERSVSPGGVPVTAVTVATNPVGTIHDLSRACKFLVATGSTAIPTLGTDGLLFDGSNDAMTIANTQDYLKSMHAVGAVWGFRCKLKKNGSDGVARLLMGTQGLSGTQHGWCLNMTAGNKLQLFSAGGTGQTIINYSSTKNFLVADGVVSVQGYITAGSNASLLRIGGTNETFTADLTKGSTTNCSSPFFIGANGGTSFSGEFCESIEIVNRIWTAQEMADYDAQTTARTTADFGIVKQWDLDFSDPTKNFADAGGTTPVTDGSVTRLTVSKLSIPADVNNSIVRNATAADDTAAPLWLEDADGNGNAGIQFNGDGVKNITYGEDPWLEQGCTSTTIFVFENQDEDNGSHIKSSASRYLVITGQNYPAGPYIVAHTSIDTGPDIETSLNGLDIIVERRRGSHGELFNRVGSMDSLETYGALNSPTFGASSQGVDWLPHGPLISMEKYIGFMSDADVQSKIAHIRTQRNISNNLL